jgi:predicted nucleotidyltransferase component of viral defense system
MKEPTLEFLSLVGGTSLALQIGHRISVDLDLFTSKSFDKVEVLDTLSKLGKLENIIDQGYFLQLEINQIKIDIVKYPYDFVDKPILIDEIRLLSIEKIAIMKLVAICNRGAKKDFVDIYFLLKKYSVIDLINLFEQQFPDMNTLQLLKSMIYFDDADLQPDPIMIKELHWQEVKNEIIQKMKSYL